jgi:3-isopropylmalate dehydrogenase
MMTGRLWKQEITRLHEEEYKDDVELTHMLADNCAMQLIANPRQVC